MKNKNDEFESEKYDLELYVTGMSVSSIRAIENIKVICDDYLKNNYVLKIVDISKNPKDIIEKDIIACPTLIKNFPLPPKRLIGDLSDTKKVLKGFGINVNE